MIATHQPIVRLISSSQIPVPKNPKRNTRDTDPDRVEMTPKNKRAYKKAIIDLQNGDTFSLDDVKKEFFAMYPQYAV
jgi:hypothetical protein